MNRWRNIEVSPADQEILAIDRIEETCGNIPEEVYKIRELITRFEVCHFKYKEHYQHILESIARLKPTVNIDNIGSNHPRHGEKAVKNDTTGRSRVGQQYISSLHFWLHNSPLTPDDIEKGMNRQIALWLGEKNKTKERLVSMLLDRLLYRSLENYSLEKLDELEYQVMATDICCYSFPRNIEQVIQGIGKLEPVKNFTGCGTINAEIKSFITKEFKRLCRWLEKDMTYIDCNLGEKEQVKIWLVLCLAKTLKEQIHLLTPIPGLL